MTFISGKWQFLLRVAALILFLVAVGVLFQALTAQAGAGDATGTPAINGTAQVEETLTADTSGISDADGLTNPNYSYQWIANDGTTDSDIQDATTSTYKVSDGDLGKTIKVRVTFTDDQNNLESLTSAATGVVAPRPPLTASFQGKPSSHDGQAGFTFELRFSEEVLVSYLTLREHAFTITGGTVIKAQRLTQGSSIGWLITVEPDSDADVTVVLPATEDCAATGAVCTADGKPLSRAVSVSIPGPVAAPTPTPEPTATPAELAPSGLTAEVAEGEVSLSWQAPAENADSVTGYKILRSQGDGALDTLVADTGSTNTGNTDTSATEQGETHTYQVQAIRGQELSQGSNQAQALIPERMAVLSAPTGLSVSAGGDQLTLTWEAPGSGEAVSYRVYRQDRDATDAAETLLATVDSDTTTYVDETVTEGGRYAYHVIALSTNGPGPSSSTATADLPLALGDITQHGSTGSRSGTLGDGENSDFRLTGLIYEFTLTDVREVSLTLIQDAANAEIHLEQADDTAVTSGAADDADQQVRAVLRAGSYRVRVAAVSSTGSYRFTLSYEVNGNTSETGSLDFVGNASDYAATLGRVQVGGTITGQYHGGSTLDNDWIGVELQKGVRYTLVRRARERESIWSPGPNARLRDRYFHEDGTEYRFTADEELEYVYSQDASFRPKKSGMHFFELQLKSERAYTFTVVATDDDYPETRRRISDGYGGHRVDILPGSHGLVEVGGSTLGRIDWVRPMWDIEDNMDSSGLLYPNTDLDWFAVDLIAGRVYEIGLESAVVDGSLLGPLPDPELPTIAFPGAALSETNPWSEDSGEENNARLLFYAAKSGTYYVIAAPSDGNQYVGDYRVTVKDVTPTEPDLPDNTNTTADIVVNGDAVRSYLERPSDHDWFAVELQAGKSYRVVSRGLGGRDGEIGLTEFTGIAGIRFASDAEALPGATNQAEPQPGTTWDSYYGVAENPTTFVFTPTRSGYYFIDVGHSKCCGDISGLVGPYEVSATVVETIDASNFAAIAAQAVAATLGETHNGVTYDPPDNSGPSWFAVELTQGLTYRIKLERWHPWGSVWLSSKPDSIFRRGVYDVNGSIIAGSSRGDFTPAETGTYYIRVGRTGPEDDRRFRFAIENPATPTPEPAPSREEQLFASRTDEATVTLTSGVITDASLERSENGDTEDLEECAAIESSGDHSGEQRHWYRLDLTGGENKTYYLQLLSKGRGSYTLGLPYLRAVFDADGKVLAHDQDGGGRSGSYEFRPQEDATYYVAVVGRSDLLTQSSCFGTYGVIFVDTTPPDGSDLAQDPSTTGSVTIGGSVMGELEESSDVDWYRVNLEANASYQIEMRGQWTGELVLVDGRPVYVSIGTLYDPKLLGVYDGTSALVPGSGSEVNINTGLDSRIAAFTPATGGVYYIAAAAESGWTGTYQLSISSISTEQVSPTRTADGENNAPTGLPTITGTAQAGQTLTADTSDIDDADGLDNATFTYQWMRDDADIAGETGQTYELTDDDVGKTIRVRVTFTDDSENEESLTSAATAAVEARPNAEPTGVPTITGTAQAGQTLTANTSGIADADGLVNATFAYQWVRDDADIDGETAQTYELSDDDVGKTIKVRVTFRDDRNHDESLTSAATAAVEALWSATMTVGASGGNLGYSLFGPIGELSSTQFSIDETTYTVWVGMHDAGKLYFRLNEDAPEGLVLLIGAVAFALADASPINGPDAGTYEWPRGAVDWSVGDTVQVRLAQAGSAVTRAPTISGTAWVGETLTAGTSGIADADGLDNVTFSYQWIRSDENGDADIAGETARTYEITDDDVGKAIKVRVSFDDDADNEESLTSAATSVVTARPLLTASFEGQPSSHDGQAAFTFELHFSEEVSVSYLTLRDHAFTVTGGTVGKAQRLTQGSNIGWRITVTPDSNADVTVVLPVTTDCEATGAVCTGDGRMLSNGLEFTVPGPGQ